MEERLYSLHPWKLSRPQDKALSNLTAGMALRRRLETRAGGLDKMTSKSAFQPRPFYDSAISKVSSNFSFSMNLPNKSSTIKLVLQNKVLHYFLQDYSDF